jgi:hypothetical protein
LTTTSSHRSDTARLAVIYALQVAKLAQDMAAFNADLAVSHVPPIKIGGSIAHP